VVERSDSSSWEREWMEGNALRREWETGEFLTKGWKFVRISENVSGWMSFGIPSLRLERTGE
jgi:hypothetical protein